MMTVTKLKYSHLKQLRELEGACFIDTGMGTDEQVKHIIEHSTAFSLVDDETVLGAGGVITQWKGVGLLWLLLSAKLRSRPRLLLTQSLTVLDMLQKAGHFHRFQVFIDPSHRTHARFVETLGFTFEGRLVNHTPDKKDHLLYARTY